MPAERRRAGVAGACLALAAALSATTAAAGGPVGAEALRAHVEALASEAMAGRLAGSAGERLAADYVAGQFSDIGLLPAGADGFIEPLSFASGVALEDGNRLDLSVGGAGWAPPLPAGWRPLGFSPAGEIAASEVVFAGYGLVAPDAGGYDSYAGLDMAGRWAFVWHGVPQDAPVPARAALSQHGDLRFKAAIAAARGAVGLIVGPAPGDADGDLPGAGFDARLGQASIPAIAVDGGTASRLLAPLGPDLATRAPALARGEAVAGALLPGVTAAARIALSVTQATGHSALGRLGVGPPGVAPVVIGAHLDHLGHGETGTSLAVGDETGRVHGGADDNASGVAALIAVARALAARRDAGRLPAARDVVFAAWSAEEIGLLGSRAWLDGAGAGPRPVAYLNLDMVGHLRGSVTVAGVGSSADWPALIAAATTPALAVEPVETPFVPTDATSFYLAGVPVLSLSTGVHDAYHTPRDLPETLDYAGIERIAALVERIAAALAAAPAGPDYRALAAPPATAGRRGARVTLGTIPDYGAADARGVAIAGTVDGGPAAEAGLARGDRIVGLAGAEVGDIHAFMLVLAQLRPGEPVEIVVLRDGERVSARIVPAPRPTR